MQKKATDLRIAKVFGKDRIWALGALALLWGTYLFVFYEMHTRYPGSEIVWALAAAGGVVLLFNTASVIAMVVHFAEDRDAIYGLDLHYLDVNKAAKKNK